MSEEPTFWSRVFKVAAHIGVEYETYRKWPQRGHVPGDWRIKLFTAAPQCGTAFTLEELDKQ